MNCIYCDEIISFMNESKEHIIQNALGGLYESTQICCNKCNNIVQREIDDKFCKKFNPVITQIENMKKTNSSAMPSCKGRAKYGDDGKIYNVIIKNQIVIDCPEYKKLHRTNLSKAELRKFEIVDYCIDIDLNNDVFKQGICKIAYNYAIEKKVPNNKIKPVLNVIKNNNIITNITFSASIIPFIALNAFDSYLELDTFFELSHTLILFSHQNYLCCYVDLFNTFQYFVVLSEIWDGKEIYEPYCQVVQKIDRNMPEFNIYRVKHIHTIATIYGVEPTLNIDKLKMDVQTVINKEPYEKSMGSYISDKISYHYTKSTKYSLYDKYKSISYYMDDDDMLREKRFRRFTPSVDQINSEVPFYFYPTYILQMIEDRRTIKDKEYIDSKQKRLFSYLLHSSEEPSNI
ncbi:HNH endonuclease [Paenibacillus radicis (ex Xue et al. 2023)]|uniref:HNH endonuclease n=1 Tax=Paenibacillus radicis (ex Xue et al. 2023) TaxID=2972489 RepID=A0ABT1YL76_9BACL|nr:HNH endonuclease [Paenibacillus radicis (ex Xue et al. 2023)]MCR8633924.1 HNH endonuclease [Paenibacillus radicis (ex Xue et al. 2023)]